MKAGTFLGRISRKLIEQGDADMVEIVGIAAGLIDSEKDLSSDEIEQIAGKIRGLSLDNDNDNTELGVGLAQIIRDI